METEGIAWAVRTEFVNIIYMELILPRLWTVGSLYVYLCLVHRYFKLTYHPPSLHKPKVFSSHQKSEECIQAAQTWAGIQKWLERAI